MYAELNPCKCIYLLSQLKSTGIPLERNMMAHPCDKNKKELGIINEKDSLKMCCKMQSIKNHNSNCRQD
jgi:hypothetical protein